MRKQTAGEYICLRPLMQTSASGQIAQCQGMMRLRDSFDNLPGMSLVTRVLVCSDCGRTALPEDAGDSPQAEGSGAE